MNQNRLFLWLLFWGIPLSIIGQSNHEQKAMVVFNLLESIHWTEDYKDRRFDIGVLDREGNMYRVMKEVAEKQNINTLPSKIRIKQFKNPSRVKNCEVLYMISSDKSVLAQIRQKVPKAILITENAMLFSQGSEINLKTRNNTWEYEYSPSRLAKLGLTFKQTGKTASNTSAIQLKEKTELENYIIKSEYRIRKLKEKIKELEDYKNTSDWVQQDVLDLLKDVTMALDLKEGVRDSLLQLLKDKKSISAYKKQFKKVAEDQKETDEELQKLDKKVKSTQSTINTQKVLIWLILFVLAFVVAIAFYIDNRKQKKNIIRLQYAKDEIYQRKDEIEKRKEEIELKKEEVEKTNRDLRHNIQSAQLIQYAMLPTQEFIKNYLEDFFILYRPQNIVSGDFYWFTVKNNDMYLAAVDCTGHGVQGAFMSMIANEILRKIIHLKNVKKPSEILTHLHLDIRQALKQDDKDGNSDGMDISLCRIQKNKKLWKLEYAGGKNYLIYVQNKELKSIKGNRFSIGGYQKGKNRIFSNQELIIEEDTTIYMFSDGFADQLGGGNRKRIGKQTLEELLFVNESKNMQEQSKILEDYLENWMQLDDIHQLDDILLMGVKLKIEADEV